MTTIARTVTGVVTGTKRSGTSSYGCPDCRTWTRVSDPSHYCDPEQED